MNNTFLIAEIGQAHDGSLGILHSYIDALSKTGVDAIKFQTHIAEAESSQFEPFRTNFSRVDKTRFDYWKRMSFTQHQWKEIKAHCGDVGLEFMSSPFSVAAVELLEEIGMNRYKVGSGEIANFLMLDHIAKTKKPIILSSGMSSMDELDETVQFLKPYGNDISILQCTTAYPAPAEKWGLNVIGELKEKYSEQVIGYSDHSGTIYSGLAAVAMGAEVLEFHAVFDKKMFGPDASSSLTIGEIEQLVKGVRQIDIAKQNPVDKTNNAEFKELKSMFGKTLAVNTELAAGQVIKLSDLESKKPSGKGLPAKDYKEVVGKRLKNAKSKYDFLTKEDLEE